MIALIMVKSNPAAANRVWGLAARYLQCIKNMLLCALVDVNALLSMEVVVQEVMWNGIPLSQVPSGPNPVDPCCVMQGDREFMGLLRERNHAEAKRLFPENYTNQHVSYLCGHLDGPPVADDLGDIPPLTEQQFIMAVDYLDGPVKAK